MQASKKLLNDLNRIKSQLKTAEAVKADELRKSALDKIVQFFRVILNEKMIEFELFLNTRVGDDGIKKFPEYKHWFAHCLWEAFVSGQKKQMWADIEADKHFIDAIGSAVRSIAKIFGLKGKYIYSLGGPEEEVQVTFQIKK